MQPFRVSTNYLAQLALIAGLQPVSAMKDLTKETMDLAAARHLADGFNFRAYTPHKIAHELMRWDHEFKDADYTQLVAAVTLWQSSSSD
jgi:hypothetical protein